MTTYFSVSGADDDALEAALGLGDLASLTITNEADPLSYDVSFLIVSFLIKTKAMNSEGRFPACLLLIHVQVVHFSDFFIQRSFQKNVERKVHFKKVTTVCCFMSFIQPRNGGLSDQKLLTTTTVTSLFFSHFDGVRALAFHPVEPVLITASEDHTLKLWNLQKTVPAKK